MAGLELIACLGFIVIVWQLARIVGSLKALSEELRERHTDLKGFFEDVQRRLRRQERRARIERATGQLIQGIEELDLKTIEWNELTEEEKDLRCKAAQIEGVCPKCHKKLSPKGSCPLCLEYPDNPNAPMHTSKRVRQWALLTDAEKEARETEFVELRTRNLESWATKGDDGVWRRKDNGAVVKDL